MQSRMLFCAVALLGLATEAAGAGSDAPALSGTWHWIETVTPVETVKPSDPEHYVLQFEEGSGRLFITADCNRGQGQVFVGEDGAIRIGPIALTRAMCPPGSFSDRFAADVGRAVHYFSRDGDLYLDLPIDSGTLKFVRKE